MSEANDQVENMNALARRQMGARADQQAPDVPTPPVVEGDHGLPEGVPWIELPRAGRPLDAFARECAAVCRMNGVFRRDMDPVTINKKSGAIERIDPQEFRTYLADMAVTYKWLSQGRNEPATAEPTTMSSEVAKGTLKCRQFIFRQRDLERVNCVRQPILRADGRIELLGEGYDDASGIFTRESDVEIGELKLDEAVTLIRYLLKDFPFVSELDLAIQFASMVSYYGALLLPLNAPRINFAFKANKHRSGKTLLIQTAVVPVNGQCVIDPWPDNPDALIQLLNSTVNDGLSYLVLDDIMGHVRSPSLNAFLTASWWGFRGMHTQNKKTVPRQAVVFLSGHEMTLQADLEGRFIDCRLHVEEADSHSHRVPNPIDESWLARTENRSDICSALCSIIRAWDRAGRPRGKVLKPGFEKWCEIFGGIVEFAGFANPCSMRPDEERGDNEFSDMAALIAALMEDFGEGDREREFTFAELVETCVERNFFTWWLDGRWRSETHETSAGKSTHRWYEPSKRCEGKMSWLFADKYGGTLFKIGGRKVRFGKRGKNRSRRYIVAVEG